MFRRIAMLSVVTGALMLPVMVQAQDQPAKPGADSNRGDRGGPGGFDAAAMRERMEKYVKEQLGNPTDEEWKVIQPKLEKVSTLSRESRGGFFGSRGGRDRGDSNTPKSDVQKAQSELKDTLDKKDASVDEINAKLSALRAAREKAKADLKAAQKDLTDVLTARQVASLVMMGMLE